MAWTYNPTTYSWYDDADVAGENSFDSSAMWNIVDNAGLWDENTFDDASLWNALSSGSLNRDSWLDSILSGFKKTDGNWDWGKILSGGGALATTIGAIQGPGASTASSTVTKSMPAWVSTELKELGETAPDYSTFFGSSNPLSKTWDQLSATERASFTNPYVQDVLNPQLSRLNEEYAGANNTAAAQAAMRGAFGGSRNLLDQHLRDTRYDKARNDLSTDVYSKAYTNAQNVFGQERAASYNDWVQQFTGDISAMGARGNALANPNLVTGTTGVETRTGAPSNAFTAGGAFTGALGQLLFGAPPATKP